MATTSICFSWAHNHYWVSKSHELENKAWLLERKMSLFLWAKASIISWDRSYRFCSMSWKSRGFEMWMLTSSKRPRITAVVMRENDLKFLCLPTGRLWFISVPPTSEFRAIVQVVPWTVSLSEVTGICRVSISVAGIWAKREGRSKDQKRGSTGLIINTTWALHSLTMSIILLCNNTCQWNFLAHVSYVIWNGSAGLDWTWMVVSLAFFLSWADMWILSWAQLVHVCLILLLGQWLARAHFLHYNVKSPRISLSYTVLSKLWSYHVHWCCMQKAVIQGRDWTWNHQCALP